MVLSGGEQVYLGRRCQGAGPFEGVPIQRPLGGDWIEAGALICQDIQGPTEMFGYKTDGMTPAEFQNLRGQIHEGLRSQGALVEYASNHCGVVREQLDTTAPEKGKEVEKREEDSLKL